MLEYQKLILEKVSFSSELFEKELKKSLELLPKKEAESLITWVRMFFSSNHEEVISRLAF